MAQHFPNGFSTAQIKYPIISSLGLLNTHNYGEYISKYPDLVKDSYIMAAEAAGAIKYTPTKVFKQWVDGNKPMQAFKVTADVTGVAGATVSITLTSASHTAGGTLSPPAVGMFFENDADGIEYEVVTVTKTVNGAHTATISPTSLTAIPSITAATAYFKWKGRPSVQEASFQQDGSYKTWTPIERDLSAIRTNKSYSDLAMFEKLEYKGESYYSLDRVDLDEQHIMATEMQLMFGKKRDNIKAAGNAVTNSEGMISQILTYGSDLTGTTTLSDGFFEDLARANDGDGFTNQYDVLCDTEFSIAYQNYLRTAANASPIVVNLDGNNRKTIDAIFDFSDAVTVYGQMIRLKKYAYFNSARTHGNNPGDGFWSGSALFLPIGTTSVGNEGEKLPYFRVRYMSEKEGGTINRLMTDGGMVGKNTTADVQLALLSWKGLEMYNLQAFKYAKITG